MATVILTQDPHTNVLLRRPPGSATAVIDGPLVGVLSDTTDLVGVVSVCDSVGGTEMQTRVVLTASQLKSLAATPVELVSAPVAGRSLMFDFIEYKLVVGAEVLVSGGGSLAVRYKSDGTGPIASETTPLTGFIDSASSAYDISRRRADFANVAAPADVEAQPLVLQNLGATEISGNVSDDAQLICWVTFHFSDLP